MAQFARPSADTYNDDHWVDEQITETNLFDSVNESVASDADYVGSPLNPADTPLVVALSAVTDPVSSSNHIVRYRYRKDQTAGDQVDLTVQLREGYVDEGTLGTLIADETHANISGPSWTDGSFTLSGGEADSITDYSDLFLRFVANTP